MLPLCLILVLAWLVPAPSHAGSTTFDNQSNWDIHYIYLSPSSQRTWGPDQLRPDQILAAGTSLILTGIDCGTYDVKMVDEDGDECVVQEIELCGKEAWRIDDRELLSCQGYLPAGGSGGGTISLLNRSRWEIHYVYLSASSQRDWGPDRLGDSILYPGQDLELYDMPCGTYDVRLIDEDSDVCELYEVDLCGDEGWLIDDRELLGCQSSSG